MLAANLGTELIQSVDELGREVKAVYEKLVLPTWKGELHGLPDALFGYMMGVFARIDLVSAHWRGTFHPTTSRMIDFMDCYLGTNHEANSVAVQMWRHKLMHTSKPRFLRDPASGTVYLWLLHWWQHLPEEQHFTFSLTGDSKVLNLGLVYLIRDLRSAIEKYRRDLGSSADLQQKYRAVEKDLASSRLRKI